VENAYIDEKEDACSALGELALNTGYVLCTVIIKLLFSMMQNAYWILKADTATQDRSEKINEKRTK